MTVAQFIDILRNATFDHEVLSQDKWAGDGATVAFRTSNRPIIDDSYDVHLYTGASWVLQTETTNYTLNKDTGILQFTSAPASGAASGATDGKNIRLTYKYAFLRDDEWMEIINNVIRKWRRKIWVQDEDSTTFDTVKDQSQYDLDSISNKIFFVLDIYYKKSTDADWQKITQYHNWTYHPETNKVEFRPSFANSDYDLRFLYIKGISEISATTDTFPVDTDFYSAFEKACMAEYLKRLALYLLKDTSALFKEMSFHPAGEVMRQAREMDADAVRELGLVKPRFPQTSVQILTEGRK